MGGLPQDEMVDALLQEFHALRIDHLSKTSLWVDLMKLVREGLSICKAENASRSTSFEIFDMGPIFYFFFLLRTKMAEFMDTCNTS